jgi:hypothetical protein
MEMNESDVLLRTKALYTEKNAKQIVLIFHVSAGVEFSLLKTA